MLDSVQNHALRLCLGASRTSPCPSLSVEANEPPLNLRRQKLSLQYALRLYRQNYSNYQNPAYNVVFNNKFGRFFQHKPNQIPPLGIRVSSDLHAVGFIKKSIAQSTTIATPPWLLSRPVVDLRLHCSDKDITPPEIFKNRFYELCHDYNN